MQLFRSAPRRANWGVTVKPDAFRLLAGKRRAHRLPVRHEQHTSSILPDFAACKASATVMSRPSAATYVSVRLSALDDADPAELATAPGPVLSTGRDNKWLEEPSETRHL